MGRNNQTNAGCHYQGDDVKPVIFLDLDETLVRQERAFHLAYRDTARFLLNKLGAELKLTESLAEQIPLAAQQVLKVSPMGDAIRRCCFGGRDLLWGEPGQNAEPVIRDSLRKFRIGSWKIVLIKAGAAGPGADHLLDEVQARFRLSMRDHICLFPGVKSAIREMAGDFRLAIITNGMERAQTEKLAKLGLDSSFEQVIASAAVGTGKPDSKIFRYALQMMACRASDALMIGDAFEADVQGALRCGIRACWLNRPVTQWSPEQERPGENRFSEFQPQISSLIQWREALEQYS
jgi:FMN phosphatase YigB (HAD superfamily)